MVESSSYELSLRPSLVRAHIIETNQRRGKSADSTGNVQAVARESGDLKVSTTCQIENILHDLTNWLAHNSSKTVLASTHFLDRGVAAADKVYKSPEN